MNATYREGKVFAAYIGLFISAKYLLKTKYPGLKAEERLLTTAMTRSLLLFFILWWNFQVNSFVVVTYKQVEQRALKCFAYKTTLRAAPSVRLPLKEDFIGYDEFQPVLQNIADSTGFLQDVVTVSEKQFKCDIPVLNCTVHLEDDDKSSLLIRIDGDSSEKQLKEDFGWVCVKLHEKRDMLEDAGIDCDSLRETVVSHMNDISPDAGLDASTSAWTPIQAADFNDLAGGNIDKLLKQLDREGYIVIDPTEGDEYCSLETDACQQEMLSDYLKETTDQGDKVRTDRVHFLSRNQATECNIEKQYDLLMGIANHFNNHRTIEEDASDAQQQPVSPASVAKPYTNPRRIQFAEYGSGDFYVAHSDNSLDSDHENDSMRRNFRAYTCILYLNDNNWDVDIDGGALRLYPHTQEYRTPEEAVDASNVKEESYTDDGVPSFVDISPINGRLLIFDSRLVHSVNKVLSSTKVRRALTLWINKPNDSGVSGEKFY